MNHQAKDKPADPRYALLVDWVGARLGPVDAISPASADASFRRYFRVERGTDRWIVMDAPPDREPVGEFVRIGRRLAALGLNVPAITEVDEKLGLLLLSDLGQTPYLEVLNAATADRLYGDALGALITLQVGGIGSESFLPPFGSELLRRELALFPDWYLSRHLGREPSSQDQADLERVFSSLVAAALAQPQVFVHRDYHSRNLMYEAVHNPGILDFQDAVLGPITYDLVSLLKDAYISWPRARVVEWVLGFHQLARESGLLRDDDPERFLGWFDLMGVQRHLKVMGIFARLNYRDGKARYLADLPRVFAYIKPLLGDYPELAPLADVLARYQLL